MIFLPVDCQDSNSDCFEWSISGECEENPAWMHVNCRRSCRTCKEEEEFDPGKLLLFVVFYSLIILFVISPDYIKSILYTLRKRF